MKKEVLALASACSDVPQEDPFPEESQGCSRGIDPSMCIKTYSRTPRNMSTLAAKPLVPTPEDSDMPLCTTALDSLGDSDHSSLHLPTMPDDFDSDGEESAWDYVPSDNDSNYCDQSEGEEYPALTVEAVPVPEQERLSTILKDNRIVDIAHYTKEVMKIGAHPMKCTLGKYIFQKEIQNGLNSDLVFYCNNCEREYRISLFRPDRKDEINDALVWGATFVGMGVIYILHGHLDV
jgi:hypothetical protein